VLGKQFIHIGKTANNFRKGCKKKPRRLRAMNCGTLSMTASNMLLGHGVFEDASFPAPPARPERISGEK